MAYYDQFATTPSRRPSLHGSSLSDPMYHTGSYEEPYGTRGFGEPFQPFPAQGGYHTAYPPPPPLMHQPFGVPREHRSDSPDFHLSSDLLQPPSSGVPSAVRHEPTMHSYAPAYANSYEDSPLNEPAGFFPSHDFVDRGRTLSTGAYHGIAPGLSSYPSQHFGLKQRIRRSSTPGPGLYGVPMAPVSLLASDGGYHQRTGAVVKFRAKGEYHAGVSLADATADLPLSRSYRYSFHELRLGHRGRMYVRVRWNGYRPLNYEIPVTGYSDGLVNMQSLARRLARAIGHFLQTNAITIPWDRVILHRLEEETPGVWLPVLTTM